LSIARGGCDGDFKSGASANSATPASALS
jgi:hypothetical protein